MTITPAGKQSGFGFMPDQDLYNVHPYGTTIAVEAGSPPAVVEAKAAAAAATWEARKDGRRGAGLLCRRIRDRNRKPLKTNG